MKMSANLANAYVGCEVCGPDSRTPYVYELPDEGWCPELSSNLGWRSDASMLSGLLSISNLIVI